MYLQSLGDVIRERRKRLGISQQELAEAAGYTSKVAISRIESGKLNLTMDKLVKIAERLDLKVSELVNEDNTPKDHIVRPGGPLFKMTFDISDLSEEDQKRVMEYVDLLRRNSVWQRLSGTDSAGDSGSASTEK